MNEENRQVLIRGLHELGLELPDHRLERLIGYHDFLLATNEKFNLTGFRREEDSVIQNLLNALAPWRHVEPSRVTADIGSGGGVPGLPLAIALEMPSLALVESKRKKCDFLREACARFAPAARVLQSDANELREPFGQIVSSGFGTLAKLLEVTSRARAKGCRILAWKGRREVIEQEIAACKQRERDWQVVPFTVPGMPDTQRHLCIHANPNRR